MAGEITVSLLKDTAVISISLVTDIEGKKKQTTQTVKLTHWLLNFHPESTIVIRVLLVTIH